jgi:hypothetical protein
MPLKITSPAVDAVFQITADPTWPSILVRTDGSGQHVWKWTIKWKTFSRSGTETTPGNEWDAGAAITNLGGNLTVQVSSSAGSASLLVNLRGTNPLSNVVTAYVVLKHGKGFDKILAHETHMRHFDASGEPIKSFDGGYGMAQLTEPTPSYEQVWNWNLNVDGGLSLFQSKISAAKAYLSQHGTYTQDQLQYEAVCRWNGGSYHVWDGTAQAWQRNPDVLCDSATGNIGWNMTDPENHGKTEAELHKRDMASYKSPPGSGAHWRYFGVCYADAVLG